jgi:dihydropteroate synthase
MQQMTDYPQGVVNAVVEYFREFEQRAAKYGIKEYVMDPGFGFAKNLEQNYLLFKAMPQLVDEIEKYAGKKRKLLVGISCKGMIWKPLGITPDEALCGTAALNLQALLLGADILRVHDVAEARQCIKLWELLR